MLHNFSWLACAMSAVKRREFYFCVLISWLNVCKATIFFVFKPALTFIFQEAHMFMTAESVEDVTEEKIRAELCKAKAQAPSQWVRRSSRSAEKEELVVRSLQYKMSPLDRAIYFHIRERCIVTKMLFIFLTLFCHLHEKNWSNYLKSENDTDFLQGTNYRKTNAAMEMRRINRESFWARAEVWLWPPSSSD